jgi:beta-lactam-binding protein with PASTA domain
MARVPNVVGMKFRAAARVLHRLGLSARPESRVSGRPSGEVIDQSPEAGVDAGEVKVVILGVSDGSLSRGPARTPTPLPVQTRKPRPTQTPQPVETASIVLPNFVGMKFRAAARQVREYGLVARREPRVSSLPAGEIVDQFPAPGTNVRAIKTVVLGTSEGSVIHTARPLRTPTPLPPRTPRPLPPRTPTPLPLKTSRPVRTARVPLPNFVGMESRLAIQEVRRYGLVARWQMRPSSRPAHEVVDQRPAPGTDTRSIRVVFLGLSEGKPPQRLETAKPPPTARPAAHPTSHTTTYPTANPTARPTSHPTARPTSHPTARPTSHPTARPTVPPTVHKTSRPSATTPAMPAISVPPVVGLAERNGAATIVRNSLRATYRGKEPSRFPEGQITRTDPSAGARLARGSLVGYWIASGENAVPNLQGLTSDGASTVLQRNGFRLGAIVGHGAADERVQNQDPVPGALARVNSAVNITLGATSTNTAKNRWTWFLIGAAVLVVLLAIPIGNSVRFARMTRSVLTIRPSLDLSGPATFEGDVSFAGPTAHLQASIEDGATSFEGGDDFILREEHDG